jgi:hypothetical protein
MGQLASSTTAASRVQFIGPSSRHYGEIFLSRTDYICGDYSLGQCFRSW